MLRLIRTTSVLVVLLGISAFAQAEVARGTIKTVNTDRKEVVFKGIVSDTVYELDKDATVWLDGARCKLSDLKPNDGVVVVYEKKGEHLMASQVRGLRNAKEVYGTVTDVLNEKKEITLKGAIRNTTYELHKTATVWVNAKRGALSEIRPGDEVLVTYEQRGQRYMANDVTVLKRK